MTEEKKTAYTAQDAATTSHGFLPSFVANFLDALLDTDLKRRIAAIVAIIFGIIYILNPGAGVFEAIPDVIPFFGNLDEAAAVAMALWGLQYLSQASKNQQVDVIDQEEVSSHPANQLTENAAPPKQMERADVDIKGIHDFFG